MDSLLSWEDAVAQIRELPEFKQLVHDAYLDANPVDAVKRFADSIEWTTIHDIINSYKKDGVVLDVGAGNGLASYAFAQNGYSVYSLEPGDGPTLGRGAIERVMKETGIKLNIIEGTGEHVPLPEGNVDIVFARQVLHHASDLPSMCKELYRVLKKDGILLATREHVISKKDDLQKFLDNHPVHGLYGGENAYLLSEYLDCLEGAGFEVIQCYGPWESTLNLAPLDKRKIKSLIVNQKKNKIKGLGVIFKVPVLATLLFNLVKYKNKNAPGRLYSFLCKKR